MRAERRKTIIVKDDVVKQFDSEYAAAKWLGVSVNCVQAAKRWNSITADGWRVYDAPEKIRERINELEGQIKMLEGVL